MAQSHLRLRRRSLLRLGGLFDLSQEFFQPGAVAEPRDSFLVAFADLGKLALRAKVLDARNDRAALRFSDSLPARLHLRFDLGPAPERLCQALKQPQRALGVRLPPSSSRLNDRIHLPSLGPFPERLCS